MGDEEAHEFAPWVISFFTEFVGTFGMLFLGCMGCIIPFQYLGPIVPSFTFGLAILAMVQTFHHFGPVHLNPAVSIAFVIMGKMPWLHFGSYLCGQFTGAFAGYAALSLVTNFTPDMCLLRNKLGIDEIRCFSNELLCSMYLILLVLGAVDAKNTDLHDSIAVRIALGVTGIIFSLEPFTGAGLNPARAIPPAVFHNNYRSLWVYLAGPPTGMAVGAVIYRFLFDDSETHSLHAWILRRGN